MIDNAGSGLPSESVPPVLMPFPKNSDSAKADGAEEGGMAENTALLVKEAAPQVQSAADVAAEPLSFEKISTFSDLYVALEKAGVVPDISGTLCKADSLIGIIEEIRMRTSAGEISGVSKSALQSMDPKEKARIKNFFIKIPKTGGLNSKVLKLVNEMIEVKEAGKELMKIREINSEKTAGKVLTFTKLAVLLDGDVEIGAKFKYVNQIKVGDKIKLDSEPGSWVVSIEETSAPGIYIICTTIGVYKLEIEK